MPAPVWSAPAREQIGELAAEVAAELAADGATLATAESLTAGMVASRLADIPGISAVLRGGLVVYASDLKASLAGVDRELLAVRGAVDPEVAAALACGARARCGSDWGLATTGVAGPTEQDGKPVGTVWLGVAHSGGAHAVGMQLQGQRREIREQSVGAALLALVTSVRERRTQLAER